MVFVLRLIPLLVLRSLYHFLFLKTWFPSLFPLLSCLTNPSVYYPSPRLYFHLCKNKTPPLTSAPPCHSHVSQTSCLLCCLKSAFTEILLLQQPSPQTVSSKSPGLGGTRTPELFSLPSLFGILSTPDIDTAPSLVKKHSWFKLLSLAVSPQFSLQALFFLLSLKCWFSPRPCLMLTFISCTA